MTSAGLGRRAYDATWGRLFAAMYDRMLAESEEAGMRRHRAELLAGASGRTLELGAGTGLNLEHYPESVSELVLTEPFEPMVRQLRKRVASSPPGSIRAEVVEAPATRLPFDDGSFETVVATLVFCSVDDVPAALAEVDRVLAPGGRLLFCEHVRSSEAGLARWQDRLEGPWRFFGHGCRCNRDTVRSIGASSLELGEVRGERLPKSVAIVSPMAIGSAAKRG
jgi:ubiquinone/menaquinone biosynthesis C-methylase UbiE